MLQCEEVPGMDACRGGLDFESRDSDLAMGREGEDFCCRQS